MLPGGAQKRDSSTSELFSSLRMYLNNKDRIQPFIGLSSIIECVKTGACKTHIFYLCEVCLCRLSKADMRRHIVGSLHRYNYIKTRHPHFVSEWEGNPTLSKLAWPLMEIAKKIEEKEGTGCIQVLEFEEDLYQTLEIQSGDNAISLINSLRWQSGLGGDRERLENDATLQQGNMLFSKGHQREPERLTDDDLKSFSAHRSYQASAETNDPLTQEVKYAPLKQQSWSQSHGESQNIQISPELSDENSSFLHDYTGPKPLIGLENMVECRSDDGYVYCFLCHYCCVRVNNYDLINHLTCSSHLFNTLMDTHPQQVELSTDINDNSQLLQSLAMEVEHSEGRGELKVLKVPHSLGSVMTGRTYHWCIKMLGLANTDFKMKKTPTKGPSVIQSDDAGFREESKGKRKRKKSEVSDTVFKVTLPLVQGSLMLRRTSFSGDDQLLSPKYWHPAEEHIPTSPELDCYSDGFNYSEDALTDADSQFQPNDFSPSADEYTEQETDDHFRDNDCINPNENIQVTIYGERNAETQCSSGAYEVGRDAARERQNNQTSHTQVWPSSTYYQYGGGYTSHWYNSHHYNGGRAQSSMETSLDAAQPHQQQQQQVQGHPGQFAASMGHHYMSGGQAPHLDVDMMYPHFGQVGHPAAHHSVTPEQAQVPHTPRDQTPTHTYGYMALCFGHAQTHSTGYQGVTHDYNYNTRYGRRPQTQQY